MTKARRCKDCDPGSRRPAPHPGPRCATHHREKRAADKDRAWEQHIQRTYGISGDDYWALYREQLGVCAICRRATGKSRRLSVDHDHESGRVRGLLCRPCNKMLGHGRDDPEFFYRAEDYLERPPAERAGVHQTVPQEG